MKIVLFGVAAFIVLAASGSQVYGAETLLESLVIKASREGRISSRAAVTVLTEEDLRTEKSATLAQVLQGLTGVDVATSGGPGQPASVFIRGSKSEQTLVLIDGIEANDPTTTTRFFDFSSLTVENFERIEIYRGSRSTKFGADAIGGVINLITRKGGPALRKQVDLEFGSYESGRLSGAFAGSKDRFYYAAGFSYLGSRGFSAADGGSSDEADGLRRASVSSRLGWDFSSTDSLDFTIRIIDAATALDSRGGQGGDDPNYDSNSRQVLTGATYRATFISALESTFGLYFNSARRQYDNNPDFLNSEDYHELFQSQNMKAEVSQRYSFSEKSHLELGLQYREEAGESDQTLNAVKSRLTRRSQTILGEALLYDVQLGDLQFETGVRHDRVSTGEDSIYSGSAGLRYDWGETGTSVQSSYGTGFKNPSLFQLYSNFGSPSLKSEKSSTLEFAVEQKVFDHAIVSLTYFRNDFTNLIDFDMAASKYANVARARTDGFEVQSTIVLGSKLTTRFGAKTLSSRDEITGLELLRRPRVSYSAQIEWLPDRWKATAAYRLTGDRDDVDPATFMRRRQPSYEVTDLAIRYRTSDVIDVGLRIDNVFDREYQDVAGYRTSRRAYFADVGMDF